MIKKSHIVSSVVFVAFVIAYFIVIPPVKEENLGATDITSIISQINNFESVRAGESHFGRIEKTSLPLPLSPVIKTDISVGAT